MEKKDLVEGMRLYIYKLRVDGRYSTAKSYQDALNSFMRFCGLEVIPYIYVNKENLRRYQAFLLNTSNPQLSSSASFLRLNVLSSLN